MDHAAVKGMRIGAMALLAAAFLCGVCRESTAAAGERDSSQPRQTAVQGRGPAANSQASLEQRTGSGAMRYYGGPKSPMWRAGAAN